MNIIRKYLAFMLIGAAVPGGVTSWQWWFWLVSIGIATAMREDQLERDKVTL